ncbi:WecB/TagA/CpsF family glycosyltransferase [Salipiger mucosus]|uniref:N-acetylmannosaminyltransferase n=1 Tax=Salipiger mucosus DSM 16094 TaxID=1123237 RepID=S9SHG5_9RHOB|nr:WecB/TagA/CpsF family glycosyltransferase [Salipiger mucosus]EPX85749.1 N-acetylmannosaminyltransferase [Salipiger mucosus DSM 16094]
MLQTTESQAAALPPSPPPPEAVPYINLLGVRVSALNLPLATERIVEAVRSGERGYICVAEAHGLMNCQSDPEMRAIFNDAFLVTPDGMPLVWELHRRGHAGAGRVYGPDLMLAMFGRGLKHYLYGATEETLRRLETRLTWDFPQAEIVGMHAPPFRPLTEAEEEAVVHDINAAAPDIVWVGIGAPKQERWMARLRDRLEAPMLIGVGAAFDFHAGNVKQAPARLQRAGLEWAFRLASEPRRLWRRYLRVVPGYLALLALQRSGLRRFPDPGPRPAA